MHQKERFVSAILPKKDGKWWQLSDAFY
jgi:hypothetical protein